MYRDESSDFNKSSNSLLTVIMKLINGSYINIDRIQDLIEESTTVQLIPCFSFLSHWISSKKKLNDPNSLDISNEKSEIDYSTIRQSAIHILSRIIPKVPPVLLMIYSGDLSFGVNHPGWIFSELYQHIFERMNRLRSYAEILYRETNLMVPLSSIENNTNFILERFPVLTLEFERSLTYQNSCKEHIKRMLMNRENVSKFRMFFKNRNIKLTLTLAIIELIHHFNTERNATHIQLLFSFSVIFLYIQSFSLSKDIDGQMICEFIKTRPFISPFCLLAIINHIPTCFYLFNLIVPNELLEMTEVPTPQQAINIIGKYFKIVDLSNDNTLNSLIEKVPELLVSYFLNTGVDLVSENVNDMNLILNILNKGKSTFVDKMRSLLEYAIKRRIEDFVIASIPTQFLDRTINLFLRMVPDQRSSNNDFIHFFRNDMSLVLPTLGEQTLSHYIDHIQKIPHDKLQKFLENILRIGILHGMHLIVKNRSNQSMISEMIKSIDVSNSVHVCISCLISKILKSSKLLLSEKLQETLVQCNESHIIAEFIMAIDETSFVNNYHEYNKLMEFRRKLIGKIESGSMEDCDSRIPYLFSSFRRGKSKVSDIVNNSLNQRGSFLNILDNSAELAPLVVKLICSTNLINESRIATESVQYFKSIFDDAGRETSFKGVTLSIPFSFLALPAAQTLYVTLLRSRAFELSATLLESMKPLLIKDSLSISWILTFLSGQVELLPETEIIQIKNLVKSFHDAGRFWPDESDLFYNIIDELVALQMTYLIDSDCLQYGSQYKQKQRYCIAAILLSGLSASELIDQLMKPIYGINRFWKNREKSARLVAYLAAHLPESISFLFFTGVMNRKRHEISILAARTFLVHAPLKVFLRVVNNTKEIIEGDIDKLILFMDIIMPTFTRLKGDEESAIKMLCGLLKTVNDQTPIEIQEHVLDSVGWVYTMLGLEKYRPQLINSSNFSPEIRGYIASSLDIDVNSKYREESNIKYDTDFEVFTNNRGYMRK